MLDTIVIGAGQAGLAVSRCLGERGADHVVLERGRVGERWRSERWDSLRLLTPNWMTRLPGHTYTGPDPDGFMTSGDFVGLLERYAGAADAPVETGAAVDSVSREADGYVVRTADRTWRSRHVVIATGWCDQPRVPALARSLTRRIHQVAPAEYRRPGQLPDGGVLVVGVSATGVQLAHELHEAGRPVTLAVGRHTRLPRRYRGMDIFWWLERIGNFDTTIDELPDPVRARHEPSLQLVGRPDRRSIDLTTLQAAGVRLTGRLTAADGRHVRFAPDLGCTTAAADRRLRRVLGVIDGHIASTGLADEVLPPEPVPSLAALTDVDRLDLRAAGITSVVWATGHRRSYPWLRVPVLDDAGEIRQWRGITPAPGLYVLGQRFQHFRSSNFIDGVGRDAAFVADHLTRRAAITRRH